jgi:hypothetical protein
MRYCIDTDLIDPERLRPMVITALALFDITSSNSLARSALPTAPVRRERRK